MRIPDQVLIGISLSISLLGLIGLFIIQATTTLPETMITNAKMLEDGTTVTIKGTIKEIRQGTTTTHLTIAQECVLKATIFELVNVTPGTYITATGEMDTYQGERSLLISTIKTASKE